MDVSASYARQNFAALLERAVAGEEVKIRRHGRVVALLVPPGRSRAPLPAAQEAKIAPAPGVPPGSAIARLSRERALRRLEVAWPRAQAALQRLAERGVRARMIGSLEHGGWRDTSDVDFLIEDRAGLDERSIEGIVRAEMADFPFDLIYAERLPPSLRARIGR